MVMLTGWPATSAVVTGTPYQVCGEARVSATDAWPRSASGSFPPQAQKSASSAPLRRERANFIVAAVGDIEGTGRVDRDQGRRAEPGGGSAAIDVAGGGRAAGEDHRGEGEVDAPQRLPGGVADEQAGAAHRRTGRLLEARRAADVVDDGACAREPGQRGGAAVRLRDLPHRAVSPVGEIEELRVRHETFWRVEQGHEIGAVGCARHTALAREDRSRRTGEVDAADDVLARIGDEQGGPHDDDAAQRAEDRGRATGRISDQ